MRILIVTGQFGGDSFAPWLLDDLATALADHGDSVDVLISDTKNVWPEGYVPFSDRRIRLFSAGPTRIRNGTLGRALTHLIAGWRLHTVGFGLVRRRRYDLVISTTIGVLNWGLPNRLRRAKIAHRSMFLLWDFFPIHHLEIGRIRGRYLEGPLRALEGHVMGNADVIAVMSPANERFLRRYHPGVRADVVTIPPWASDSGQPDRVDDKVPRFTVIFGGQLALGRGVDVLLGAARILQDRGVPLDLLIAGDGPARSALIAQSDSMKLLNTRFLDRMPRDAYRRLLRSAHAGVAITVPHVTPPTFPSKISEYCAAGLPVVVCVEPSSDAGQIVEQAGAGLAVVAGHTAGLADALEKLHGEYADGTLDQRALMARSLFERRFSVARAADSIRAAAKPAEPTARLT